MTWQGVAREHFDDGVRSRSLWVAVALSFIFVLLFGRFASRGGVLSGSALFDTNARTFLFFLTVVFVPVFAFVTSVTALHTRADGDSRDAFVGTVVGRLGVFSLAVFVAFFPVFVALFSQSGTAAVSEALVALLGAVLFGLLFLALGLAISTLTANALQAAAGAVVVFLVLYAWPFVLDAIGLGVPHAVLEQVWVVFVLGGIVTTLFSLGQGSLSSSLFSLVVLGAGVVGALAIGYVRFDAQTAGERG